MPLTYGRKLPQLDAQRFPGVICSRSGYKVQEFPYQIFQVFIFSFYYKNTNDLVLSYNDHRLFELKSVLHTLAAEGKLRGKVEVPCYTKSTH